MKIWLSLVKFSPNTISHQFRTFFFLQNFFISHKTILFFPLLFFIFSNFYFFLKFFNFFTKFFRFQTFFNTTFSYNFFHVTFHATFQVTFHATFRATFHKSILFLVNVSTFHNLIFSKWLNLSYYFS